MGEPVEFNRLLDRRATQEKVEPYAKRLNVLQTSGIPFPIPLADLLDPDAKPGFFWRSAYFVFGLPAPREIPSLDVELTSSDSSAILRFMQSSRLIAGYSLLNQNASLTMRQDSPNSEMTVETSFPSRETQQGFATQLRQLYGTDAGSFRKVAGAVSGLIRGANDESSSNRTHHWQLWETTEKKMRARSVHARAQDILISIQGNDQFVHVAHNMERETPEQIIATFFNAEFLHWGSGREKYAEMTRNRATKAHAELDFIQAASDFALFYMGVVEILEKLFPQIYDDDRPHDHL